MAELVEFNLYECLLSLASTPPNEPNDKSKNNKDGGQKLPGIVAFRNPKTSTIRTLHRSRRRFGPRWFQMANRW
jgi:hypothetical protein